MASGSPPERPFILVLAGVNGAGKSSVGGEMIRSSGLTWFNPDRFSRELIARTGMSKEDADSEAWAYGKSRLESAIATRTNFAFETTLGGNTIPRLLGAAAETHDVVVLFCGLASVEMHIDRVRMRVRHGGHDIPEDKIRKRWTSSRENLIELLPRLAQVQLFDNSAEVAEGDDIPPPRLVLEMKNGRVLYPPLEDVSALEKTPEWAKPIVAAAFKCHNAKQ